MADEKVLKNTWLWRIFTLTAIAVCKRFRPRRSSVLFLTNRICVKYGRFQHLSEAMAMQFIGASTSIPVPKVYCAFEWKGSTYIVMSRVPGSPIGRGWSERSDESKAQLLEQLRGYIQEMRALKPPKPGVQGVDDSQLFDVRIPKGTRGFGPFENVPEFHSFLVDGFETNPDNFPDMNEMIRMQQESQYSTCFTHGDLNSVNIHVNGDKVVGIVDWDTSGWYPEYWEYTTAWNVHPYNEFWRDEVGKFLQEYPEALKMEQIRQKYFSDI